MRTGNVLHLHVDGQLIRTTPEHPFYVFRKGWTQAGALVEGDWISTLAGGWVVVEELYDTGLFEAVYNLRVAEDHTYFVGDENWAFGVWAHNAYAIVHQWDNGLPNTKHFSVEIITDNGVSYETHQMGGIGTDAYAALWTGGMTEIGQGYKITISNSAALAAIAYEQTQVGLGVTGPYDIWFRSCTVYVYDVLTAAGITGLPSRPVTNDTSRANQMKALVLYRFFANKTTGG